MSQGKSPVVQVCIGIAVGLGIISGVIGFLVLPEYATERAAINAGDELLTKIAQPWDGLQMYSLLDPKTPLPWALGGCVNFASSMDKTYGSLKSVKGEIKDISKLSDMNGPHIDAQYIGDAEFEKGRVKIGMTLIQRDGNWYFNTFRINPPGS
ncbi:MAG: hypothetical protein KF784_12525 [Fimbriimonadaceae bacterium]|nr:hypothetical protein [Fimbriimonadaceae bacterium]